MNSQDNKISYNIDQCLVQLADILKKMGVAEYRVGVDYEQHIIDHDIETDSKIINEFYSHITQMYSSIVEGDFS
jgi:hypothetical protein